MNFKDKVVIITGGTSGIGKQAAIEFSRKGAHVVAFTVDNKEVCEQAIKEIGNDAFYIHCDVSKEEDVKKAIEEVVLKYGRLDCAFNNAGIGPDGVRMPYESLTEISEKTWDLVVDVDMKGVFLCLKYELLQMQKQGFEEPTGQAKITLAYNLPCRYVLHTVGPIINGHLTKKDCDLLAGCYTSCLQLAADCHLESVAFCCISTGVFHFPNEKAAEIAIASTTDFLKQNDTTVKKVVFNVFKENDKQIYERLLGSN